ncbi:hypothetical protein GCM10023350_15440 [Nocardioides endophyticus]|uniref:Uncharacterized protein n=1 Tax=Nocardioides endophyticus TaxID=1353775 RepID=A0ABP8YMJ1_9ACTN
MPANACTVRPKVFRRAGRSPLPSTPRTSTSAQADIRAKGLVAVLLVAAAACASDSTGKVATARRDAVNAKVTVVVTPNFPR